MRVTAVAVVAAMALAACGRSELYGPRSGTGPPAADAAADGCANAAASCLRVTILGAPGRDGSVDGWLASRGARVRRLDPEAAPLAGVLDGQDLVILDHLAHDHGDADARTVLAFVESGGGLLAMTGFDTFAPTRTRPNGLIAPLGVQYLPGVRNVATNVVTDLRPHPTTAGLTFLRFWGGYAVGPTPGASGTGAGATVVALMADGAAAGVAVERGRGRAFVWGDEWIEFPPVEERFWGNLLAWLAPR